MEGALILTGTDPRMASAVSTATYGFAEKVVGEVTAETNAGGANSAALAVTGLTSTLIDAGTAALGSHLDEAGKAMGSGSRIALSVAKRLVATPAELAGQALSGTSVELHEFLANLVADLTVGVFTEWAVTEVKIDVKAAGLEDLVYGFVAKNSLAAIGHLSEDSIVTIAELIAGRKAEAAETLIGNFDLGTLTESLLTAVVSALTDVGHARR